MDTVADLDRFLSGAHIDDAVRALRPDYRAALVAVSGIAPGPSSPATEAQLRKAEQHARDALARTSIDAVPHVASWREAYRGFGAKPQRTRNSVEALLRRVPDGLPRVNNLTDVYNAVSVQYQVPIGGEDLRSYVGSARLVRAMGDEAFDTVSGGDEVVESPPPGEVVWCDDKGVTCRRWNWRQGRRTRLRDDTDSALFIIDALEPVSDSTLHDIVDDLSGRLRALGEAVTIRTRTLR